MNLYIEMMKRNVENRSDASERVFGLLCFSDELSNMDFCPWMFLLIQSFLEFVLILISQNFGVQEFSSQLGINVSIALPDYDQYLNEHEENITHLCNSYCFDEALDQHNYVVVWHTSSPHLNARVQDCRVYRSWSGMLSYFLHSYNKSAGPFIIIAIYSALFCILYFCLNSISQNFTSDT